MNTNFFYRRLQEGKSIKQYSILLEKSREISAEELAYDCIPPGYPPRFGMGPMFHLLTKLQLTNEFVIDEMVPQLKELYRTITAEDINTYSDLLDHELLDFKKISESNVGPYYYTNCKLSGSKVKELLESNIKVDNLKDIANNVNLVLYDMSDVTDPELVDKFCEDFEKTFGKYDYVNDHIQYKFESGVSFEVFEKFVNFCTINAFNNTLNKNAINYSDEEICRIINIRDLQYHNDTQMDNKALYKTILKLKYVPDLMTLDEILKVDGLVDIHTGTLLGYDFFRHYFQNYDEKIFVLYEKAGVSLKDILSLVPKERLNIDFIVKLCTSHSGTEITAPKEYIDFYSMFNENLETVKAIKYKGLVKALLLIQINDDRTSDELARIIIDFYNNTLANKDSKILKSNVFYRLPLETKYKQLKKSNIEFENDKAKLYGQFEQKYNTKGELVYTDFNGKTIDPYNSSVSYQNYKSNNSSQYMSIPINIIKSIRRQGEHSYVTLK